MLDLQAATVATVRFRSVRTKIQLVELIQKCSYICTHFQVARSGKPRLNFRRTTKENDNRKVLRLLKLSGRKQGVFATVNHQVGGSSPPRGAILHLQLWIHRSVRAYIEDGKRDRTLPGVSHGEEFRGPSNPGRQCPGARMGDSVFTMPGKQTIVTLIA